MTSKPGDVKPGVSAQQAIEEFLFEMMPTHNELADRLAEQKNAEVQVVEKTGKVKKKGSAKKSTPLNHELAAEPAENPENEALELARKAWGECADEKELEQERLEQERLEQERLEQERLEQERLEQKRLEQERLVKEQEEEDSFRVAAEHAEEQRRVREKLVREKATKQAQEKLEQERQEKLILVQSQLAKAKLEKDKKEQEEESRRQQSQADRVREIESKRLAAGKDVRFASTDREVSSIAARRAEAKRPLITTTYLPEAREPASLEMKLVRARLASSFEESGQTRLQAPAPQALVPPAPPEIFTPEPVEIETKAEEPLVSSIGIPGEAVSEVLVESQENAEISVEKVALEPPADWTEEGRPLWAAGRFECLLFTVAGLKLAVPLVALGSIHPIEKSFTPIVGRANWFMGLMPVQGRRLRVVDTGLWVMPEKYKSNFRESYKHVIRLGRSNWGIACHEVVQAITLKADEVRWRTQRSKRPWLAGTVVEYMCALMDVETFEYLLAEADRTGKPMQF